MTEQRTMKNVPMEERKKILLDLQIMKSRDVREKYNITNNTLGHIRFFYGKSNAVAGGYFHKDLLQGAVNPLVEKIRELKRKGRNSLEVARELRVDLATINKNWVDEIQHEEEMQMCI